MIEFKPVKGLMGPFGHWHVKDKLFYTKREAFEYASTLPDASIVWRYYNEVFDGYDTQNLGKIPLQLLYPARAKQLRESYDWLTLNYSGGSDSHNILMTYINNGIKLDHVYVNWPMKTVDNKTVYVPNTADKSSRNLLSEWDYAIKPTLDWLKTEHPDILIEVGDWTQDLNEKQYREENFMRAATYWGAGSLFRNLNQSAVARKKVDAGLKVADIYGFDKPHLFLHPDNVTVSMFFHDVAFQTATNATGTFEPFYWTPHLPELAFEMAHVNFKWYNNNPKARKYLRTYPMKVSREIVNEYNNELCRKICYPHTWEINKFQSGKPWQGIRTDRDFWIYKLPDFRRLVSAWQYHHGGFLDKINERYFDENGSLIPIRSQFYVIGKFDKPWVESDQETSLYISG